MITKRLELRRWQDKDLQPFQEINADPRVMEFFPGTLLSHESDAMAKRLEAHFDKHGFGLWAVELRDTSQLLGFVGLQHVPIEAHFTPAIEIGWRIAFDHWGKGYATEAAQKALDAAFRDFGLSEVVAMAHVDNRRSHRVMEKIGMTYNPADDFLNPHPKLKDTWLAPSVLYRASNSNL